jgi:DNA polymerase-3 subunit alpha
MPADLSVNLWRAKHFAAIDNSLSHGQKIWQDKVRGQDGLFGVHQETSKSNLHTELPDVKVWTQAELSKLEKAAVGFYLSTHPLDEYGEILSDLKILNIADYPDLIPGDKITIAGIVSSLQTKYSKKGNRFCIFRLEDQSIGVKCLAWSEASARYAECLKDDELLIISGRVESSEGQEITLILEEAKKIADAVTQKAQAVSIILPEKNVDEKYLEDIFTALSRNKGNCEVFLSFRIDRDILLKVHSPPLRIQGSSRLESDLKQSGCQVSWLL